MRVRVFVTGQFERGNGEGSPEANKAGEMGGVGFEGKKTIMAFLEGIRDAVMRRVPVERDADHPRLGRGWDVYFIENEIQEGVFFHVEDKFEETREGSGQGIGEKGS